MDVALSANEARPDKALYPWTAQTLKLLAFSYLAFLCVPLALAGSRHVPALACGTWFFWQPLGTALIATDLVAVLDTGEPHWDVTNSVSYFVAKRAPSTAFWFTIARFIIALALAAVDIVYLVLNIIRCLSTDNNCTLNPDGLCCKEGNLVGTTLACVLFMAFIALAILYILARMPWAPTFWLRDPASLRKRNDDLELIARERPVDHAMANPIMPAGTVRRS